MEHVITILIPVGLFSVTFIWGILLGRWEYDIYFHLINGLDVYSIQVLEEDR